MSMRSKSPPLPTFGVRDLDGPANPPGLVSISRSQYDSTIKSQPDAKLLYLDDDDGELITVGSSLELSQRLDDPVLKYTRDRGAATRNHSDGRLVHVFDITHSSGSLAEWRDHQAYSSKTLRPQLDSFAKQEKAAALHFTSYPPFCSPTSPVAEKTVPSVTTISTDTESDTNTGQELRKGKDEPSSPEQTTSLTDTVNILDGIEEHLSGLADVLKIAASTLQKAADRTRDTDTSVVEDILKGVKGILTEVGFFGLETFKEFARQAEDAAAATDPSTHSSSAGALEGAEVAELAKVEEKTQISEAPSHTYASESPGIALSDTSSKRSSRVKFTFEEAVSPSPVMVESMEYEHIGSNISNGSISPIGSSSSNPNVIDNGSSIDGSKNKGKNLMDDEPPKRPNNPSILDDSSEDADFLARYPPLRSVRRARSTIESTRQSRRDFDPASFYAPWASKNSEERVKKAEAISACEAAHTAVVPPRWNDRYVPSSFQHQKVNLGKPESTETARKPLPGAWPDVKNDSNVTLPISAESSGAFFNRMTGRGREMEQKPNGLHRANTTASSNPASRLNGPFDPGFPYDPSSNSASRSAPMPPFRPYRRSASPSRLFNEQLEAARSRRVEQMKAMPKLDTKRSVPNMPRLDVRPKFGDNTTPASYNASSSDPIGHTKFDSHRAVRHHRSVPHFNQFVGAPPRTAQQIPMRMPEPKPRFADALSSQPDFLTGPSPSNPPPIPFTARPACVPQIFNPYNTPAPRNYGQWSSPPANPMQPQPSGSTTTSSMPQPPPVLAPTGTLSRWRIERDSIKPKKNKFDSCVESLKMCGFGIDDSNLKDRLHVYAVAADGDVHDAVEMIEEDRKLSRSFD